MLSIEEIKLLKEKLLKLKGTDWEKFLGEQIKILTDLELAVDANNKEEINIKYLKDKIIVKNKFVKLKVLGTGELKEKLTIKTDFISKSAKDKIEKAGGLVNILNTSNNK